MFDVYVVLCLLFRAYGDYVVLCNIDDDITRKHCF